MSMKFSLYKSVLLFCCVFVGTVGYGQDFRMKQANKLYSKMAYYYAAEAFEDVLSRGTDSMIVAAKLADCYDKMEVNNRAALWYQFLEDKATLSKSQLFRYALVLGQLKDYALAYDKFVEYEDKFGPNDVSRKKIAEYYLLLIYLEHQKNCEVSNELTVNTAESDIGIAYYKGGQVLLSNATRTSYIVNRNYERMGNKFYSLYRSEVKDGQLDKPTRLKGNSRFHDGPVVYDPVNDVIYFTRSNAKGGKRVNDNKSTMRLKLYRAKISSKFKVTDITELSINGDNFSTGHPSISDDGKTLFFASDRPGGFGGSDIWRVEIDANGRTGDPVNLGSAVNTSLNEMFPYYSSENNLLVFSSDGHMGLGGLDLFFGYLDESMSSFTGLTNFGAPINSEADDFGMIIDKEIATGYFISNRYGGKGDDDVYSFKLHQQLSPNLMVHGKVFECVDNTKLLSGAKVTLKDSLGNYISHYTTDEDGYYRFYLSNKTQGKYYLEATMEGYNKGKTELNLSDFEENNLTLEKNICLPTKSEQQETDELILQVIVLDSKTQMPIDLASVVVFDDLMNQDLFRNFTGKDGIVQTSLINKKRLDDLVFRIRVEKDGFRTRVIDYAGVYDNPGVIRIVVSLDMGDLPSGGQEIIACDGKRYVLNPIYFDLDKHNIRPDAALELNKIVELLNNCPEMRMEIGSHTDCRHSYSYNENLSNRRAQSTLDYIASRISNPSRLSAKGYGEHVLAVDCPCEGNVTSPCSEEQHQLNRRTEFRIKGVSSTQF